MKQQVQRKTLSGGITKFSFDHVCGEYLVKNFSDNDAYVSFEDNTGEDESIKIAPNSYQVVVVNYYLGGLESNKTKDLYVKGTGEVEVQQLCWHKPL